MWFIPACLTAGAVVLAVALSTLPLPAPLDLSGVRHFEPDAARAVLTTLAGASITVAALVLSMTMVVLSATSSQFGPRLLPNFIGRTGPKIAIGGFTAAFAYQVVVASTIGLRKEVPDFAIWIGIVGALASFTILIFFIHMVAQSIQAPYVIDGAARTLDRAMTDFTGLETGPRRAGREAVDPAWRETGELLSPETGYIHEIENGALAAHAEKQGGCVHCVVRPGGFVAEGDRLAVLMAPEGTEWDTAPLAECFGFGPNHSPVQDPEFAIRQLVEIALRALSPGINDPYTAMNALDRVGGCLRPIVDRAVPRGLWHDDDGILRLLVPLPDAMGLFDSAYLPLRQHARRNEMVAIALMESYLATARRNPHPDFARALRHHADLLWHDCQSAIDCDRDLADLRDRHRQVIETLGENG